MTPKREMSDKGTYRAGQFLEPAYEYGGDLLDFM
jgi:hypothetical protein